MGVLACVHTISLPFAFHALAMPLPLAQHFFTTCWMRRVDSGSRSGSNHSNCGRVHFGYKLQILLRPERSTGLIPCFEMNVFCLLCGFVVNHSLWEKPCCFLPKENTEIRGLRARSCGRCPIFGPQSHILAQECYKMGAPSGRTQCRHQALEPPQNGHRNRIY